jgi:hypothetical protein
MQFCTDDTGCSGTGARCAFTLVNDNGDSLNVKVCSNACDPILQVGCPSGLGCMGYNASGGDYTDCRLMGTTNNGGFCSSSLDCRPGSLCVNDGSARCRSFCKLNQSGSCPSTQTCDAFANTLSIGSTTYGFCH